jgi:hypothetical protein
MYISQIYWFHSSLHILGYVKAPLGFKSPRSETTIKHKINDYSTGNSTKTIAGPEERHLSIIGHELTNNQSISVYLKGHVSGSTNSLDHGLKTTETTPLTSLILMS